MPPSRRHVQGFILADPHEVSGSRRLAVPNSTEFWTIALTGVAIRNRNTTGLNAVVGVILER